MKCDAKDIASESARLIRSLADAVCAAGIPAWFLRDTRAEDYYLRPGWAEKRPEHHASLPWCVWPTSRGVGGDAYEVWLSLVATPRDENGQLSVVVESDDVDVIARHIRDALVPLCEVCMSFAVPNGAQPGSTVASRHALPGEGCAGDEHDDDREPCEHANLEANATIVAGPHRMFARVTSGRFTGKQWALIDSQIARLEPGDDIRVRFAPADQWCHVVARRDEISASAPASP